ncbi:hypothetical protein KFE25_010604 [Diacronema lutheri]|uniref:Cation efflux protein transmembrane domain-containing protein n=1 Tax=Diacronema lutheri TaxID=2081491 RepID=A0A8J5XI20_DIALT|nr:hypothetical protein KFE25_010604 [Diacronema lutheri]
MAEAREATVRHDGRDEWHDAPEEAWRKIVPTPLRAARTCATCCCASQDERTLSVTLVLFSLIVISQFVGAYISNSRALLIDAGSMLVDVATYVTNLWAECVPMRSESARATHELFVAGGSLLALWVITLAGVAQAAALLHASGVAQLTEPEPPGSGAGVDGGIVLGFACVGIAFDAIALGQFAASWRAAQRANSAKHLEQRVPERLSLADCLACVCGAALELNMSSALAHVLADLLRSVTTLVESILILRCGLNSAAVDGLAALCVAAAILVTALGPTRRWFGACSARLARPPPAGACGGSPRGRAAHDRARPAGALQL